MEVVILFCCVLPCLAQVGPAIPVRPGLSLVEAYRNAGGDFETIITVTQVDATAATLTASSDETSDPCAAGSAATRRSWGLRTVSRGDLEHAPALRQQWSACPAAAEAHPGTTAISLSARILRALETNGQVPLTADTSKAGMVAGTLTRIERTAVPLEVVVNDRPSVLPTIHARWHSSVGDREYWILDDASNALVLRATYMGTPYLQVVKVSFPTDEAPSARVDRALATNGRIALYGIYFNSGSDRLRDESEPMLASVARILRQHPGWSLTVEGHTDDIGTAAGNLELSKRRALAVVRALAAKYGVDPARLRPVGFGASRPNATNDTLEGRARNRRVELVRE